MDLIANYDSSESGNQQEVKAPRKMKSYTTEFNLKVIKYAKDFSKNQASLKYGVDRASVSDWFKQEGKLHQIKNLSPAGKFKKNLPGGGRPLIYSDLDKQLAVWVRNQRSEKKRISHSILQQQATKMLNAEQDEDGFKIAGSLTATTGARTTESIVSNHMGQFQRGCSSWRRDALVATSSKGGRRAHRAGRRKWLHKR